jgi:hypothetical protein
MVPCFKWKPHSNQQGMLTPPRHLILPLVLPGVHVSLIFDVDYSMYLVRAMLLIAYFSVQPIGLTDFDYTVKIAFKS